MRSAPAIAAAAAALLAGSCAPANRAAHSAPPAPPTVWERQIRNAADAGDGDYRLRVLRQRVAAEPESIPARLDLARAYDERGYPDIALEICRLAAARFPDSAPVAILLARSLRIMNLRAEAIAGLEGFLKAHPQPTPEPFSWLGILRDESGLWAEGEPAHRRALELAPSRDSLHNNLGYNLLAQKKDEEAAAEFREALRLNPSSAFARNNLGLALARSNAPREALAQWQSAAGPADAHNNLAAVLIETGRYTEARAELNLALGYNGSHPAALRNVELVSRLDGGAASMPAPRAAATRWRRFKTAFARLWTGPLQENRSEPAGIASAPPSGEKR
jgi:tetratricopeptide (TPR) repeat protein